MSDAPTVKKGDHRDSREIIMSNIFLEEYYKHFLGEEEFSKLMKSLRTQLPQTFRVSELSTYGKTGDAFVKVFDETYAKPMASLFSDKEWTEKQKKKFSDIDVSQLKGPFSLPWAPNQRVWQIDCSKTLIRRHPHLKRLHQILTLTHDLGLITRQEAVSMLPPMFLDVKPGHSVLDMCAAPGSKTTQLIDYLHSTGTQEQVSQGLLIANDLDLKRCYVLLHNALRVKSPLCVVTNNDASEYPDINIPTSDGSTSLLRFDRILCDVPCSGDGTIRKSPDVWWRWSPQHAFSLHKIQLKILLRACRMLKVGGRVVYSTCSMNVVENEAVVAACLRATKGRMRVVDASGTLPDLKRAKGLTDWDLMLTFDKNDLDKAEESD
ncbi:tRNA (cytosine(34)-C(5))-methyltransferase, partial [Aduncisulcus paluster]